MIRIMIVDDHPIVRAGLRSVLETQADLHVVAEAADGCAAVAGVGRCRPDVVLIDLRMPRMGGVDAIRAMLRDRPDLRVIALTSFDDVEMQRATEAGALGCLLKDVGRDSLFAAVRDAAAGRPPQDQMVTAHIDREPLSVRELQVLRLVADGLTNQSIARTLLISTSTVKTHLEHLFAKLGVRGRAPAVRVAIERGQLTVGRER